MEKKKKKVKLRAALQALQRRRQLAERRIASEGEPVFTWLWWCCHYNLHPSEPCPSVSGRRNPARQSAPRRVTACTSLWPQYAWEQQGSEKPRPEFGMLVLPLATCVWSFRFLDFMFHQLLEAAKANQHLCNPFVFWRWLQKTAGDRLGREAFPK